MSLVPAAASRPLHGGGADLFADAGEDDFSSSKLNRRVVGIGGITTNGRFDEAGGVNDLFNVAEF